MRFFSVCIIYLLILFAKSVPAQKIIPADREYHFTNYSIDEGLNVPNINSFYQDSKGNLWICGRAGVAKFDGINFTNYTSADGLPSGGAGSVCEDKSGNIWFGTWWGLAVLRNNKFYLDTSEGMPRRLSWGMFGDKDGTFWSANHEGLFHIDPLAKKKVIKHYVFTDIVNGNAFRCVFRNEKGNLIAGAESGCFTLRNDSLIRYIPDGVGVYALAELGDGREWVSGWGSPIYQIRNGKIDSSFSLGAIVLGMAKDKSGNIFLATWDKGIYKYDGKNFTQFTIKNGLSLNSFWTTFCDKEGNIWFGSWGEGISRYSGSMFTRFSEKSGLLNNVLIDMGADETGNIWLGAENGITKYNLIGNKIETFGVSEKEGDLYSKIMKILVLSENEVWGLGYANYGLKIKNGKVIHTEGLTGNMAMHDSKNRYWMGAEGTLALVDETGKLIRRFDIKNVAGAEKFNGLYEDLEGNIWITSSTGGINFFDGESVIKFGRKNGYNVGKASAIVQYQRNRYLIAVSGKGILNYYFNNGQFKLMDSINEKNGLLPGSISSLQIRNNIVYAAGVRGLNIFDLNEYKKGNKRIKTYSEDDGLTGKQCHIGFIDSVGLVWIYSNKGAFCFDPDAVSITPSEPQTNITAIKLFYEQTNWEQYSDSIINDIPHLLKLPYDKNHLTFSFNGISFSAPHKVKYKYKLEGYDKSWSPPNKNNEATYSNISPGTFTFMVIACNKDGVWNKIPAVFTFTINPPFWRTSWFYIVCAGIVILSLYLFIRYRERKLQFEKAILEDKVKQRTRQLETAFAEIEEKQKEIIDSIRYAKRIQLSLLASEKYIWKNIKRMKSDNKNK